MLQHKEPVDLVIATGETHSVREFAEKTFAELGIEIVWKGKGVDEKGYDSKTNKCIIEIDAKYVRPTEVDIRQGDPSKAKSLLGWAPKTGFDELVKIMVKADYDSLKK